MRRARRLCGVFPKTHSLSLGIRKTEKPKLENLPVLLETVRVRETVTDQRGLKKHDN